jgi:tetratricopeptide (TPR) repeat protein
MLAWFLLGSPFSFNYSIKINEHYRLAFLLPAFPIILIIKFFDKDNIRGKTILLVSVLILSHCVLLFSKYYSISNEHFFIVLIIASLMYSIIYGVKNSDLFLLVLPIILGYFAEIVFGLIQVNLGYAVTIKGTLNITASLRNSGIYACYLVVGIPLLYYFLFYFSNDFNKIYKDNKLNVFFNHIKLFYKKYSRIFLLAKRALFCLVIAFCIYVLYHSQSRTAIIALTITIVGMLLFKEHSGIKFYLKKIPKTFKWVLVISIFIISSVILYYLFYLKEQSAFGRLLIWQVAIEHIRNHFWLGTGLGRFTWYYPQWQSAYFQTHLNPPKEFFLNAGESYILMNEYLQLFEEVGFLGFACFGVLFYYFFSFRSACYVHLLNSLKATVIAILACGFSSYPFHVNSLLFLLAFCFAIGFALRENKTRIDYLLPKYWKYFANACIILLIFLSAYASYSGLRIAMAVKKWHLLRSDGDFSNRKLKYASLYQALHKDGKFLTEYGECLLKEGDFKNACRILEEAKQYFISFETIKSAGLAYKQAENYPKSIENFEWLENYIPNHFGAKYELLQLYKTSGNIAAALKIRDVILNMPVKVPSYQVDNIKAQTQQILTSLQK